MKCIIVVLAVVQTAFCGNLGVPYSGGIQYVSGHTAYSTGTPYQGTPVATSGLTTSTFYGNPSVFKNFAPQTYAAAHAVHAPVVPQVHAALPAPVLRSQITPVVQTSVHNAIVPTVHQVPAVADVPVTRIQAQHGFIQKEVDVAKPAVQTRRFELRRPAIQKQFYDIEERVIVRPAGSALVELDQPHSKVQKSSVVSPVVPAIPAIHAVPAHFAPSVISASPAPPTFVSPAPPSYIPSQQPGFISTPSPVDQGFASDDDTVVVEARRRPDEQIYTRSSQQNQINIQPQQRQQEQQIQQQQQEQQQQQQEQQQQQQPLQRTAFRSDFQQQQQPLQRTAFRSDFQQQIQKSAPAQQAVVRSRIQGDASGNQQRLIDLLTAREGVADVGFNGNLFRSNGDAGQVRARVISAEYAPKDAPLTGERVNTRRVVVSRPIETIEEVDVVEPVTKLERVSVQHPALFKTAHVGYERVPTSVPVLGKAIAPYYQKSITPVLSHQLYYQ